jgi:hypothetical protein
MPELPKLNPVIHAKLRLARLSRVDKIENISKLIGLGEEISHDG